MSIRGAFLSFLCLALTSNLENLAAQRSERPVHFAAFDGRFRMRSIHFYRSSLCPECSLSNAISCGQGLAHLQAGKHGLFIVPVFINSSGPHPFLLDTGSSKTIARSGLLRELGIPSASSAMVDTPAGTSAIQQAAASTVAVAGLTVPGIEIEETDSSVIDNLAEPVEGILGEDFLKHFDFLIDNHAKTLLLDSTASLSRSLVGDHLPLSFFGSRAGDTTIDRLIFELKLPSSKEVGHFLIDSGANYPIFFPTHPLLLQSRTPTVGILRTFGGDARCYTIEERIEIGRNFFPAAQLALCEGLRSNMDVDGVVPTRLFDRFFVSHAGAYAIANPHNSSAAAGLRKYPKTLLEHPAGFREHCAPHDPAL
jgi:predicted aspartyl protease